MSKELKEKIDAIIEQDIVDIKDVIDDARLDCFDKAKKLDDGIERLCSSMFDHNSNLIETVLKLIRDQIMEAIDEEDNKAIDDGK